MLKNTSASPEIPAEENEPEDLSGSKWTIVRNRTYCRTVLLLILPLFLCTPQSYKLDIRDIDTQNYPIVRIKASLYSNAILYNDGNTVYPKTIQYTLYDNNTSIQHTESCPSGRNSVALVLDNSYSMKGVPIAAIKYAASMFVDSLRPNDECSIASFTNGGEVSLDFTTDKEEIKTAISKLWASEQNGLANAIDASLRQLAKTTDGERICVILSDWTDPQTAIDTEYLSQYALDHNIMIFSIHFDRNSGVTPAIDPRKLALSTGGLFLSITETSISDLFQLYNIIASDILSSACTITYTSYSCEESLHNLKITAEVESDLVVADTVFFTPARPDMLSITVASEQVEVVPTTKFHVYFGLSPYIDPALPFSMRLLVRIDPETFSLYPPLITDGMIIENASPTFRAIEPGLYEITASSEHLSTGQGNLAGITLLAKATTASHPAYIILDSVEIYNGCPNIAIMHPDTVFICNCSKSLPVTVSGTPLFTGEEMRIPVEVERPLALHNTRFSIRMHFDSRYLEPVDVDGIGTILENASLTWRLAAPDTLEVFTSDSCIPENGNVLFYVRFRLRMPKSALRSQLTLPSLQMFSDCCYHLDTPDTTNILIDGTCNKIVRRTLDFSLAQSYPNPAREKTQFHFLVYDRTGTESRPATLTLYNASGILIDTIYDGNVQPGEYTVPYLTSPLPAGKYYYILTMDGASQTRSLTVIP